MDFGNLNEGQKTIARKIAAQAREQGVDPELALAVGWAESKFRNTTNPDSGATGPMQVMPSNAAGLRVKVADLRNVDINIKSGVGILKENLGRYDGNEKLAVMAYNWRPNMVDAWAKKPDEDKMPAETRDYLQKVSTFRPINGVQAKAQEDPYGAAPALPAHLADPGTQATPAGAPAASQGNEEDPYGSINELPSHLTESGAAAAEQPELTGREHMGKFYNEAIRPMLVNPETKELDKSMGSLPVLAGLGTGAVLGAVEQGIPALSRGMQGVAGNLTKDIASSAKAAEKAAGAAQAAASAMTAAAPKTTTRALEPGEKWGSKTGFGPGVGGPASVEGQTAAHERAKKHGKVSKRETLRFGVKKPGEPDSLVDRLMERSKVAEADKAAANLAEKAAANEAKAAAEVEKKALKKAALEAKLAQYGGNAYKFVKHIPGLSVLGGYMSAEQALEALEALEQKKYGKAAIQGAGALGTAAALVPFFPPPVRAIGAGLSALSVPAQMAYDYAQEEKP